MSLRRCSRPSRPRTDPSQRIPPGGRGELERHGLDYEIDWHLSGKPFITGRGKLVAALSGAIKATLDVDTELSTTGGTSDGRFIADICAEVVEFGPINASIHQINECIEVSAIEPLAQIYERTLHALLAA